MNNIEKFAELKRLYELKSEYHKRQLQSSVRAMRTKLDGNGVVSDITKVTSGIINLYNTFSNSPTEEKE